MKGAFGGQLAASAPPRGGHAGPPGSLGEAVPEPRCTRAPGQRPVCGVAGPGPTVDAGPALEPVPGPERPPPAGPRSREAPRISRPGGRPAPEAAGGGRSTGSLMRPSARQHNAKQTGPRGPRRPQPRPFQRLLQGDLGVTGSMGRRARVGNHSRWRPDPHACTARGPAPSPRPARGTGSCPDSQLRAGGVPRWRLRAEGALGCVCVQLRAPSLSDPAAVSVRRARNPRRFLHGAK